MNRLTIPLLLAAALLSACGAPTTPSVNETHRYLTESPVEIAVLAIVDGTPTQLVPTTALRSILVRELIVRGYTTLSRDWVDAQVEKTGGPVSASMIRLGEAGVLEVRVDRWRSADAATHGRLAAGFTAALFGVDGQPVWERTWSSNFSLDATTIATLSPANREELLMEKALRYLLQDFPHAPEL